MARPISPRVRGFHAGQKGTNPGGTAAARAPYPEVQLTRMCQRPYPSAGRYESVKVRIDQLARPPVNAWG